MSAALTLATGDNFDQIAPLIAAFHAEVGIRLNDTDRTNAIAPILDGIPCGAAYLIGRPRAPIGYIIITFGWSIGIGDMDGFKDELYVRSGVRNLGIASEVLLSLPRELAGAGLKVLQLKVHATNERAARVYARAGFRLHEDYTLMTRRL